MIIFAIIFTLATMWGLMQRIRWANARRYNMPASKHPAFVAAHPESVVPRPWAWRVTYGVAFIVWLAAASACGSAGSPTGP